MNELGCYPKQRPVRPSTEEQGLGNLGQEAEPLPGTEIDEGETERDVDLIDRGKEPKLSDSEWNRLRTCERPCSREEWRLMTNQMKWRTLGSLGLLTKKETTEAVGEIVGEEEQRIPGPPQFAKAQPPPRLPSTYTKDRPRLDVIKEMTTEGGTEKEKAKR